MRVRLVVALLLLLVAIGLPVAAVSGNGPPWGFRGHHAVVIDTTGTVEGTASEARRAREDSADDKLEIVENLHLDAGDELRVARFSKAHLRFPDADVIIGDGGRVVVEKDRLRVARGTITVRPKAGAHHPFVLELEGSAVLVSVRGGSGKTEGVVIADGKGGLRGVVKEGTLDASTPGGDVLVEPEKMLVVEGDTARVADRPAGLEVSATCAGGKLNVVAPPQTQLFAAGALAFPDVAPGAATGSAIMDVEPGVPEVAVFARDIAGNVTRVVVPCEKRK